MCDVCCKEFKGWCKSFTRTEALLSVLEAVVLVVSVGLLAFLILHLIVCQSPSFDVISTTAKTDESGVSSLPDGGETSFPQPGDSSVPDLDESSIHDHDRTDVISLLPETSTKVTKSPKKVDKDCTWTPSAKTDAPTRYFEQSGKSKTNAREVSTTMRIVYYNVPVVKEIPIPEESDGEDSQPIYKGAVLALVKTRPQQDIVFGCILTLVSEFWTLTAASCLESIEEVDSLDSFVIMESYDELANGATHAVADVQINPLYKGSNKSYDLAALKCEVSLTRRSGKPVTLPRPLDYLLLTVGEGFTILGYGKFRTVTDKVAGRRLRQVDVHGVPSVQCAADADTWAPKHLWGGAPAGGDGGSAGCGVGPLCAGRLRARAAPCNYCAGTPLLAGRRLLGVMAGDAQCGVACEPAFYVNVAAPQVRDWIDSVVESD